MSQFGILKICKYYVYIYLLILQVLYKVVSQLLKQEFVTEDVWKRVGNSVNIVATDLVMWVSIP